MEFREYQNKIKATDSGTGPKHGISPPWLYYVLGIGGETGELIEKIKKLFRDDHGQMTEERKKLIVKEMGDCFWYHARLASLLGIDLNEVVEENLNKLLSRLDRGTIHGDGDDR